MSSKRPFTVEDAYAISTPADSVRLYGAWAGTYDQEFVNRSGYVLYKRVAEIFLQQPTTIEGAVLDVGCGTGIVGEKLHAGGIETIDGVDISEPMLAEAASKTCGDDAPVYRNLIAADLTRKLGIPDCQYAGLISAGTFTHGHLGPGPLDELWRVAAPGARCAISIRSTHFEAMDFGAKLSADAANGRITKPGLVEVDLYSKLASSEEHVHDKALVVVCQVI